MPFAANPQKVEWLAQNVDPSRFLSALSEAEQVAGVGTNFMTMPGVPGVPNAPTPGAANFGFASMTQPDKSAGMSAIDPKALESLMQMSMPAQTQQQPRFAPAVAPRGPQTLNIQQPQMKQPAVPSLAQLLGGR